MEAPGLAGQLVGADLPAPSVGKTGWNGSATAGPQTSGGQGSSAGLPLLNPLCLPNRYPGESCPAPFTFCFGCLQLSKYFSYLFGCIHVQLLTYDKKNPPL